MESKYTNKRLVRKLMDTKGIATIMVTEQLVSVIVKPTFTPSQAQELCRELGHTDFRTMTKGGDNFIIFQRY